MSFYKFTLVLTAYVLYVLFRRLPIRAFFDIQKEITMSKEDLGVIVSCHSICFTISKLVLGIAADRHSSVALLLTGLMIASLSSVILAYAQSFFTVLLVMIMVGAVQGAAWVPATKLVASWYEGSSFGTMFSLLGCGATVSGLIISPLSKYYWRDVGLYLGGSSCVFCVFALLALNEDNHSPKHYYDAGAKGSPFWDIISSKVIWGVSLCYIFTLETRTVAETWFPLFLEDNQLPISTFMVIYEISGIVGTMASGFLLDRISAHLPEENARRLVGVSSSLGMLLSYMLSTSYPEYNVVFAFLCGLFTNASMNMWCIIVAVAGQKHIAGSCSAFISFVANFGSIMAGSPLAHLISLYGYKVFVPFFATQIALLLAISSLRIPLKMGDKPKDE